MIPFLCSVLCFYILSMLQNKQSLLVIYGFKYRFHQGIRIDQLIVALSDMLRVYRCFSSMKMVSLSICLRFCIAVRKLKLIIRVSTFYIPNYVP